MKKKSREHARIIGALVEIRQKAREMEPKIEASNFLAFVHAQKDWSFKTFGPPNIRGPVGPLKHLEKEAREAYTETDRERRREELADCMFLVLDASNREGLSFRQLTEYLFAKLRKNQKREWPLISEQDPNGATEHVRKPGEKAPELIGFDRAAPCGDRTIYPIESPVVGASMICIDPKTLEPKDCCVIERTEFEKLRKYLAFAVEALEAIGENQQEGDLSIELEYVCRFARETLETIRAAGE